MEHSIRAHDILADALIGQQVVQMALEHLRHFDHRLEPAPAHPAKPIVDPPDFLSRALIITVRLFDLARLLDRSFAGLATAHLRAERLVKPSSRITA
jgi:hypothetical protein